MKIIKSIIKTILILSLSVIILVQPLSVSAATTGGRCGANVTWSLDFSTGVLTISGTGAMYDFKVFFSADGGPPEYYSYGSSVNRIIISSGVTRIGAAAFIYCGNLTSVSIPNSVTSIGSVAFTASENVYYGGTSSQWNAISIDSGNDRLTNANIYYNHYYEHSYTSKTTTSAYLKTAANCTSPAVYYYKCSYCNEKGTNTYTYGALGHSFTSKTISSAYLKSVANCTSPAVYYYKCSYCSEKGTNTYTYGNALEHNFTSKTTTSAYLNSAATCTSSAVYYYKCSKCSAKSTKTYTYGSALGHSYKTTTTKATTSKNGKLAQKCSRCGTSKTTTIFYPKTVKLSATTYTYDGKAKKPSVTVKDSKGNTLKNGTDYTVSYPSGRKECGTYTVTVTFKGNYSGKKSLKFKINLGKVSGLKQQHQKGIQFKWNKVAGAAGYEVEVKKGSSKQTITTKTNAVKNSKMTGSATFKVRAYRIVNGKKIYGSWSDTKTFKAK